MTKIILASGSPRRRELLAMVGFDFEVMPADVDETVDPGIPPNKLVVNLAIKKALHVRNKLKGDNAVVIGADTVVAIDDLILGKPKDEADAFDMLSRLQGRAHTVYTGVAVASCVEDKMTTFVESTEVFMRPLGEKEIRWYMSTGEPFDKAGAYGIQEKGAVLIERVEGDYFTVVGLPLCRLNLTLGDFENKRYLDRR
ncbi:MAG: Maf family protein [Defluviitaleaceae bacterium]|nr:Maf family protein [Defluviitaleaceae bacterium]